MTLQYMLRAIFQQAGWDPGNVANYIKIAQKGPTR